MRFGDVGSVSIGGEAAYLDSNNYSATKFGGVLGINPGPGVGINAAVGKKMPSNDVAPDATYFTFELVLFPHR